MNPRAVLERDICDGVRDVGNGAAVAEPPVNQCEEGCFVLERDVRPLEASAAFVPHLLVTIDEDVRHVRIGHEGTEGAGAVDPIDRTRQREGWVGGVGEQSSQLEPARRGIEIG